MKRTMLCAAVIGLVLASGAADYTWQGGDGLFSDAAKWSPTGVPGAVDKAKFSVAADVTVLWTESVTNGELQVVQTDGNTLTWDLGDNAYTLTNRFSFDGSKASSYVVVSNGAFAALGTTSDMKINAGVAPARLTFGAGVSATLTNFTFYRSELNVETGAVVTFNGECKFTDNQPGAVTRMNVNGGDVVCNHHFKCPESGRPGSTSILNIASGSLVAKQYFSVGDKNGPESVGIVNLSGGYLETWGTVWLGNSGGALGIANISGGKWASKGSFEVSHREYTTAFLNMSGGEIEMAPSKYFGIAYAGGTPACDTGTVSLAGGRIIVTNNSTFYVGAGSNCFGRCVVGGTGTVLARDFLVASSSFSEGECLFTGGVVQVNNTLSVGGANLSAGRMLVDGGAVTNLSNSYIANATGSQGALALDSGSLSVAGTLNVGQNAGSAGRFVMGGGDLFASTLVVGNNGVGTLLMSNGTAAVNVDMTVGMNGTGSVEMVDGALTVSGAFSAGKNMKSDASVVMRGGLLNAVKGFRIGDWGGRGAMSMYGGTVLGGSGGSSSIGNGNSSTGSVVMADGLIDINNSLYVANNGVSTVGRLAVDGGTLAISSQLVVGNNAYTFGEVTVNGGNIWVGGHIRLGVSSNTYGSLTVSGGSLTNANYIDVGHYGTGLLHVAGGEVLTRLLRLTPYNYTNGAPVAEVIVSGGLLHVTGTVYLADAFNSTSKVTLVGGTFKLPQLWNNRGTTIMLCDGGELEAARDDSNFINTNVQVLELTANGLYVDSAGFGIGTSRDLPDADGEHGKLGKRGPGTFTLYANTTFTGPVVVEGGELALGSSGLVTLAGGCEVDGGALLNLSARALDFTLPAGTVSRVDGELRLAGGKTLTVASGATLAGTGVVGRVVLEPGATLARAASAGGALLHAGELVVSAGATLVLTGYTAEELRQGIPIVSGGALSVAQGGSVAVTLDGVAQENVALRVSNGLLTAFSYNPGTLIKVH